MKNKKLTKKYIADKLEISHSAVVQWQEKGIPAKACIDLEPILKIKARKLFLNNNLLFDMFNSSKSTNNKAIINE